MAKNSETKTYTCAEPIKHDGELYAPDEDIDLTKEQAEPLLSLGHVREKTPKRAEQKGEQK